MTIYEIIIAEYPDLVGSKSFFDGTITIRNDSDGVGDYIEEWNYDQPIPEGLSVGKPNT
jgi:hypothetical protein